MIYTIFMLPILMLLIGYLMFKYPPKKINLIIGYRTFKSMENEKTWKQANQYCGRLWIKLSTIMLTITFLLFILMYLRNITLTENILLIFIFSQLGIMILSIFIVENKIKIYV